MPLVTSSFYPEQVGWYEFPVEHKELWSRFWDDHNGDLDKIVDFAKKAGIKSPKEFYNALHWFLFDSFSGNPEILKSASSKDFSGFLGQVLKNHLNNPKDKNWYKKKNTSHKRFLEVIEGAVELKNYEQAVAYVNARITPLGSHLFHEWLLSQTKQRNQIKSIASDLSRCAYEIEKNEGRDAVSKLKYGSTVGHILHPDKKFFVLAVIGSGNSQVVVARNGLGHRCFIPDVWNIVEA